jgi:hypothetical protein
MGRQNIQIPLDFLSVGWLVIATNNLLLKARTMERSKDGTFGFPAKRVYLRRKKNYYNLTKDKEYIGPLVTNFHH